jgi:hypothetical protein
MVAAEAVEGKTAVMVAAEAVEGSRRRAVSSRRSRRSRRQLAAVARRAPLTPRAPSSTQQRTRRASCAAAAPTRRLIHAHQPPRWLRSCNSRTRACRLPTWSLHARCHVASVAMWRSVARRRPSCCTTTIRHDASTWCARAHAHAHSCTLVGTRTRRMPTCTASERARARAHPHTLHAPLAWRCAAARPCAR